MLKRLLYAVCLLSLGTGAQAVDAPTILQQTDYDGESLTLSWNAVEGATGYRISVWSLGQSATETQEVNLVISKDKPALYTPAVDGHLDEAVMTFSISETDGLEADQTLPLIFRQVNAYRQISSVLRGDIYMGQLAAYNQLSSNTVFGGYALSEYTQGIYIEAGPQGQQPSAPGVLTVTKVVNRYRPNVYLIKDEAVDATVTSLQVNGLNPAVNYYASVTTVSGSDVSIPSEVLRLDGVLPTVLTGATNRTTDSYTANWEPNPKASSYVVTNYEIIKADGTNPLNENGAKCNEGTFDSPVTVESFDDYTNTKGWSGMSCLIAKGMFGVPDGQVRGGRPFGGYLIAPAVDLSANNGKMTLSVALQATPGDVLSVYAGSYSPGKAHSITVPENGKVEGSFDLTGGSESCNIHIESTKLKKFFIENFSVAQGEPVELVMLEDDFDKATSGTFDSPIERISADDYTEMPGWKVNSAIAAEGMFGTFDGMIVAGRNYGGGEMTTPPLGFADGDATVSLRLQSSMPGEDQILVYAGDYNPNNVKSIPVPENGIVETTVTVSGAYDGAKVHIDSKQLKKFMLDNIRIYQMLQPGQKSYVKGESATVQDATSYTFTGLKPDSDYGYKVRADYVTFAGYAAEGPESDIMEVGSYAAIDSVIADSENASPVVSVILTDLTGRRVVAAAPGTFVIRTEIHADGSVTSSKHIIR